MKEKRETVALLIDQLVYEYHAQVWNGVVDQARKSKVNLVTYTASCIGEPYSYSHIEEQPYNFLDKRRIDGVIILSSSVLNFLDPGEKIETFNTVIKGIPSLSIGLDIPGHRSITVDNYSGMFDAAMHLIQDHGRRKIAFIGGPETSSEARARFDAYKNALQENNISFDQSLYYEGDFTGPSGAKGVKVFLDERKVSFDALICATDMVAFEAMRELQLRGISIPTDVAMCGFDNVDQAIVTKPPLASVKQPMYEIGRRAIIEIVHILNNEKSDAKIVFPTQLVRRQSCGCVGSELTKSSEHNEQETKTLSTDLSTANKHEESLTNTLYALLEKSVETRSGEKFLSTFDEFLQTIERYEDISSASNIISDIRDRIFRHDDQFAFTLNKDSYTMKRREVVLKRKRPEEQMKLLIKEIYTVEEVLHQARMMISQKNEQLQFVDKLHSKWSAANIIETGQNVLTAYTKQKLFDVLDENLKSSGLDACFIVRYSDGETESGRESSNLSYIYSKQQKHSSTEESFDTNILLPDKLWNKESEACFNMVIRPLFFEDTSYGYIVYVGSELNGQLCEVLSRDISSAFHGISIYENQLEAETNIRHRSERIDTLVQPMLKSIMEVHKVSADEVDTIRDLSIMTEKGLHQLKVINGIIEEASSNITNMLKMIEVIDELSANINILAINASIESAHAGDYGLGFQVISQEVQQLSDSTAQNAKEISETLKNIVESIQSSMQASRDNFDIFTRVKDRVEEVTAILTQIIETMSELSFSSNEILSEFQQSR